MAYTAWQHSSHMTVPSVYDTNTQGHGIYVYVTSTERREMTDISENMYQTCNVPHKAT